MGEIKIFDYTLVHATIRASTPIVYAALAAVISRQANVFNIAIEGIMLSGAFAAVVVSYMTGSWVLALLSAIVIGVAVSALVGTSHIKYHANILVVGLTINLLAIAVTRFLLKQLFGTQGTLISAKIIGLPKLTISAFADNPMLSSFFSDYSIFELSAIFIVVIVWFILYKTTTGLRLRSVGLFDKAAETAGINVNKTRYQAILWSGVLAGIGGAHLSLGYTTMFVENMTNGRGFMGVAASNFGGQNPIMAFLGCLIFGFSDSLGAKIQAYGIPAQLILMIPYIITVIILTIAMISYTAKNKKEQSAIKS